MKRLPAKLLSAAATGFLLALAFPPAGVWPLAWVALVPLLWACKNQRFLTSFLLGLVSTGALAVTASSGLFYADKDMSGENTWIVLGCVMFGAVMSIVAATFGELKTRKPRRLVALAAMAVLLERCLMTTLPVTIALTQPQVTAMRLLASGFGIWAVAFLLWLANIWIASAIPVDQSRKTVSYRWQAPVAFLMVIIFAAEIWEGRGHQAGATSETRTVILVQSDSTDIKELARLGGEDPKGLAIWPEFGGIDGAPSGDTKKLRALSEDPVSPAIVTSFRDDHTPLPHNVASLFWRGNESARYAKRMLFGGEKAMHTEGDSVATVDWFGTKVALSICFDSCFPGIVREATADSAVGIMAVPTIDMPSPHHWIAAMHAAFVPFRAAESGITLARDDGFAYSEVVDSSGNIVAMLPPGERVGKVSVPLIRRWTLNRQIGDSFLVACLALLLWGFIPRRVPAG